MAGFGGDSWITDQEACTRLGQTIMELINERDQLQRSGSNYSKINGEIRSKIRRYQQDVQMLEQKLSRASSSYHITQREAERRRVLIDNLLAKEKIINNSFKKDITYSAPERTSLLPSTTGFASDVWGGVSEDTRNMNIDDLQQEQQRIIQEQDDGLDVLSSVIAKQKKMGQVIGQEVDEHNEIIDDITTHVGKTDQRLIKETKHVRKVSEKAKDCSFFVVIILLLVAIVIIAVIPYNKKP